MTSRILKEIHETAKSMYDAGIIDTEIMRKFDDLCLPQTENQPTHQNKKNTCKKDKGINK